MFVSTLGNAVIGTLGTCFVGTLIDRVMRWLGSGDSCHGSVTVVAGCTSLRVCPAGRFNFLTISAFVAIALSVRGCNCFICPVLAPHCLDCFRAFRDRGHYFVCMRYRWLGNILVAEVCRVRELLAARSLDVTQMGSVMFC